MFQIEEKRHSLLFLIKVMSCDGGQKVNHSDLFYQRKLSCKILSADDLKLCHSSGICHRHHQGHSPQGCSWSVTEYTGGNGTRAGLLLTILFGAPHWLGEDLPKAVLKHGVSNAQIPLFPLCLQVLYIQLGWKLSASSHFLAPSPFSGISPNIYLLPSPPTESLLPPASQKTLTDSNIICYQH